MAFRFQKPVTKESPPAHLAGDKHEGDACRAKHPVFGWGWFAVDGEPNFDKPVSWVEENPDDPEHKGGWWVYTKDCD